MKSVTATIALGDVADLIMGQAPPSKDTNFDGRGTPFIKVGEFGDIRPVVREWTTNPLRMALRTDVLLCVVGATCGKINLGEECAIGRSVAAIRPDPSKLDQLYLYYFMMTLVERLRSGSIGAAQTVISKDMVESVQIPLPQLYEQQRIVGLLDKMFADLATAKANAEKNLQNARALFESQLQSVFTQRGMGWRQTPLAELCDSLRGITYGVIKLGDENPTGVPCLRTSNVRWLRIETEGMKRIAPNLSAEYSRTILRGGEVLVNVRGTLGGVAVASAEMAGWNVSREVAVVPIDSTRVNPEFVSYFIGSGASQKWLGSVKKGAAYVGINLEDLRLLPVGTPSMAEQKKIVSHLDSLQEEIQRLASLYEQKLAALKALKKSLLHQAFTGGI